MSAKFCTRCDYHDNFMHTCVYILRTGEPRGCSPENCKILGKYKPKVKRKRGKDTSDLFLGGKKDDVYNKF